MMSFT